MRQIMLAFFALVAGLCASTSAHACEVRENIILIHNIDEARECVTSAFANNSIFRGSTYVMFRRNFPRTTFPFERAKECKAYTSIVTPGPVGEGLGRGTRDSFIGSLAEYIVYEIRDSNGGLSDILAGAAVRGALNGFTNGFDNAENLYDSLLASCTNGGNDIGNESLSHEELVTAALSRDQHQPGDWFMIAIRAVRR